MIAFLGLLLAWFAVFGGVLIAGGEPGSLTNIPAALIVLGGTLAAGLIQADLQSWRLAWVYFPLIFFPRSWKSGESEAKLVRWCQLARRNGLLSLEPESGQESDEFLRLGLQLLVDGESADKLRHNLEVAIEARERRWAKAAILFDSMGNYAPTMGILGAALGLIQMLTHVDQADVIASGLASAFVAIVYGVALANLFFIPIASRMKSIARHRSDFEEMAVDGFLAISQGENPRVLARRLKEHDL